MFQSCFSGRQFCSNGTKADSHEALLKARKASENQKEGFACVLQNACSEIFGKAEGKRLCQSSEIKNTKSIHIFKKMIVTEKQKNSLFSVYVKLLTRLRLQFSYLSKHKSMCGVNVMLKLKILNTFSCVAIFFTQRFELFININKVDLSFTQKISRYSV